MAIKRIEALHPDFITQYITPPFFLRVEFFFGLTRAKRRFCGFRSLNSADLAMCHDNEGILKKFTIVHEQRKRVSFRLALVMVF